MKKLFLQTLLIFSMLLLIVFSPKTKIFAAECGQNLTAFETEMDCNCTNGVVNYQSSPNSPHQRCCGWVVNNTCSPSTAIDPFGGVTNETLDTLNPLQLGGSDSVDVTVFEESQQADTLSKPGGFINRALEFAFPLAGLILFVMITLGGFQILASSTGKKDIEAGKKRVSAAIIGFIILFASYWIVQILEQILGINVFNS